jgi:transcriptional regulator with XRE-family HTH domain
MKTKELLLECKIAAKVSSDYALAKALGIPRQRVAEYMSGKQVPDTFAAVKIALLLRRDPVEVIALIESETEKNPAKRAFWTDFLQRVRQAAKLGTLAAVCMLNLFAAPPDGKHEVFAHNA